MTHGADTQPRTGWRPDDIVAYEEMRDLAVNVQTLLISQTQQGDRDADHARVEAATVRRETLAIDGFDRAAVDAHTRRLALRTLALRQQDDHDA